MKYNNFIKDGIITVFADAALYSKECIFKCMYWYGDKFHTNFSILDSSTYEIILKPLSNNHLTADELEIYLQKLERDLIDFQLRQIVINETQNVRDLLIAKAFSNGEFDEDPQETFLIP